ncbi:Glycoside-hydrolase family GH114 [Quadrisphaera granulorum]|uniref:Glycosyl hydrolase family 114 n=1 Tax=Quadrisphaera granulorum TaxID=317664 RepID=A0A316AET0_9ACTN|nr:glycosyl hydrolase family 114 [Quadrisphaera granulorum]SZE98448.1 Glycoside-hydrolase family GH114 [Quadrisphaera granulorum]
MVVVLALTGCASSATDTQAAPQATPEHRTWSPPPSGTRFDYQLSGPYTPPGGVTVVARDRTAQPAGLGYDICYVNGFQTQPQDSAAFAAAHPDLVVQTADGPLADPGWPDELLFDTSTAAKRAELSEVVGPWIRGCAESGFDAVEIDNLDSWTRSQEHLTAADNTALAEEYVRVAHEAGLAIAQKNTPELSARLRAAGYDFAVAESCAVYEECDAYTDHYPVVLDIEYTDGLGVDRFDEVCRHPDRRTSVVLRDHDLLTPDDDGYAYQACPA